MCIIVGLSVLKCVILDELGVVFIGNYGQLK